MLLYLCTFIYLINATLGMHVKEIVGEKKKKGENVRERET